MNEGRIHQFFEISILLKGAHAAIECLGGIALAVVSTKTIVSVVNILTQDELLEDPKDFVATHLLAYAQGLSVSAEHFYAFYLVSHGVVELFLVAGLLKRKYWAYPASLVILALFVVYQIYRFSLTHGIGLILLTLLDAVVMVLIWHEYHLVQRHRQRI